MSSRVASKSSAIPASHTHAPALLIPALLLELSVIAMAAGWQTQDSDTSLLVLLGLFSAVAASVEQGEPLPANILRANI